MYVVGSSSSSAAAAAAAALPRSAPRNEPHRLQADGAHEGEQEEADADAEHERERLMVDRNSGTTAIVALLQDDWLVVANVGDSQALLVGADDDGDVVVSRAHKPDDEAEMRRIVGAGGRVNIASGVARVNGYLAMSRSLGDLSLSALAIALPDVTVIRLRGDEVGLVLGSDGLFDCVRQEDVVVSVLRADTPTAAAHDLTELALLHGSTDNTTAAIIRLGGWGTRTPSQRLLDALLQPRNMTRRCD